MSFTILRGSVPILPVKLEIILVKEKNKIHKHGASNHTD